MWIDGEKREEEVVIWEAFKIIAFCLMQYWLLTGIAKEFTGPKETGRII